MATSSFSTALDEHLLKSVGVAPDSATPTDLMLAVSGLARQQLSARWVETQTRERAAKARRVYYLSMEFLIGRTMSNALAALELRGPAAAAVADHANGRPGT